MQYHNPGPTEQSLPCTGISLPMPIGDHPREKGPGELEDVQEPSLLGLRMVDGYTQKSKQRWHGSRNKEPLTRHEKAAYNTRKQEQATWGDATSKHAQVGLGKTKPKWSWMWQGRWRATKKRFSREIISNSKTREKYAPQLSGAEDLLREDTEKAKVLTATFASVVSNTSSPQEPWTRCR